MGISVRSARADSYGSFSKTATWLWLVEVNGAWSQPAYARWTQAFAGGIDHPKITVLPEAEREAINLRTRRRLQPALIGTQG